MIDNVMGPNPLWLTEWLCEKLTLTPAMRVLDLGCGKALTSIFLAREFGVLVTAADLWIEPSENQTRIEAAGCADRITPVRAEAHTLPFAETSFDAIISVDAYHYFGTDDLYIGYISRFLKPGGNIGIVVPGLTEEVDEAPEHLRDYWEWDFASFHTHAWWARHWRRTGRIEVTHADWLADGWRDCQRWEEICATASTDERVRNGSAREADMLTLDAGRTFGFVRLIGTLGLH
jgi:cyclopropane fatty-acyl-phospholipid synthase-like methyltransferase